MYFQYASFDFHDEFKYNCSLNYEEVILYQLLGKFI